MSSNDKTNYDYTKVPIQENVSDVTKQRKYGFGVRHVQLAIILLCLTVNIIGRGHMGVSIVAMTDVPEPKTDAPVIIENINKSELDLILAKNDSNNYVTQKNGTNGEMQLNNTLEKVYSTFKWPKSVQEMVLNAFFLGYTIMMFPMGLVCQRYGGKLPLQIALLVNGLVSIVTPWLTVWGGWKAVCACRILQGLSQAGTYPSVQAQLAKWASINELATLSNYVHTGTIVGTVVAYQLAGFLCESTWGWPSTFYAFGVISLVCFVILTMYGTASPAVHNTITDEEKDYILGSNKDGQSRVAQMKLKTPWRAMIKSKPIWAVLMAQFGSNTGFVFFFNQVPSYIHNILGIDVKGSGILSSLPYIASFFTSLCYGWISDYCINNNIMNRKNARRTFNTIALFGLTISLVCTSYASNTTVAVTCLVLAMATHIGVHSGWMINIIDLSPNFTGSMMATNSTISMSFVLLSPIVISYVVTDTTNITQWRTMFFIIAGFCVITNTIFFFMLSSDVQPWNYPDYNEKCRKQLNEEKLKKNNEVLSKNENESIQ